MKGMNNVFTYLTDYKKYYFIGIVVFFIASVSFAQQSDTYTTSGSWVCPPGVTEVQVEAWGGGAGGRNAPNNVNKTSGGGGGGGAYARRNAITVIPGNTYSFTIGAGGSAHLTNSTAGGNTTATIEGVEITAAGGASPGAYSTSTGNSAGGQGGQSADCVGDVIFSGGNGGSNWSSTSSNDGHGGGGGGGAGSTEIGGNGGDGTSDTGGAVGVGGSSNGGNGGAGGNNTGGAASTTGYGGGGGGGGHKDLGGAGRTGAIIFTYTCPAEVTANAGTDQTLAACETTTTLAGNTTNYDTGTWTVTSGTATITDPTDPISGVTGLVPGTTATLRWTVDNGLCGSSFDEVDITAVSGPGCHVYCTPTGNLNCSATDYISNVVFVDISRSSTCDPGGYINTGLSTIAIPGYTYQLSVTNGPTYASNIGVWIDFNNNGVFSTDEYFLVASGAPAGSTSNVDITIPSDATIGTTRMRIRLFFSTTMSDGLACTSGGTYGETEDYSIEIREPNPGEAFGIYIDDTGVLTNNIVDCEIHASNGVLVGSQDGDENYTITYISGMKIISVDNNNCLNVSMTVSTDEASPDWTGSTAPLSGTGSPVSTTYTTTGFKSIVLLPEISFEETLYEENFEGTASGWTGQATSTPGSSQNYWMMGTNTTTPKAGWYSIGSGSCGANNTVLTGNYSPRISYYKSDNPFSGPHCNYSSVATATTNLRLYSPAFSTSGYSNSTLTFNYVGGMNADDNVQLQYSLDGVSWTNIAGELYNSSVTTTTLRTVSLPAGAINQPTVYIGWNFNSTTTASSAPPTFIIDDIRIFSNINISNSYTDFINITMDKPDSGTIIGSNSVCNNDVSTYNSSEAGTPGYTYSWSLDETGCGSCASVISPASITTSSPVITLTHAEATPQIITLTETITSECCGPLTPVEFVITINPSPSAPAVSDANPSICEGGSTDLVVDPITAGYNYNWYDAATDGNLLGSGAIYTVDPVPNGGGNYYVEAVSDNGCESATRTLVALTEDPTEPSVNGSSFCSPGAQIVSVDPGPAGTIYTWYDAAVAGSTLQTGAGYDYEVDVNCGAPCTVSVWVSATEPDGCSESGRVEVTADLTVSGATTTWTGTTDDDWFDATNWSDCVPNCDKDAIIPNVATKPVIRFDDGVASGLGGIATVQSITIEDGSVLTFGGGDGKATLEVCGNWTQSGASTLDMSEGRVVFKGAGTQTFTKLDANAGNFYNLEISNTAAYPALVVSDNNDLIVDGDMVLTDGIVQIPATRKLIVTNNNPGSMGIGNDNSWIHGIVQHAVTGSGGTYNFPVGNEDMLQQFQIINTANISGGLTDLTVNFYNPVNSTSGLPIAELQASWDDMLNHGGNAPTNGNATNGVWSVSPNTGSMDYGVRAVARNFDNAQIDHTVLKRADASSDWELFGAYDSHSLDEVGGVLIISRTGLSGFSEFGVGSSATSLPIEMGKYYVECIGNAAVLTWETLTETNNKKFIIERAINNDLFEEIGEVAGAENSSTTLKYSYTDNNITADDIYYYRLKQVDNDHKINNVSAAKKLSRCGDLGDLDWAVYSYQGKMLAMILENTSNSPNADFEVFDAIGKKVYAEKLQMNKGFNRYEHDFSFLETGIYFVIIKTEHKVLKSKISFVE
jgi:hypothetical protein